MQDAGRAPGRPLTVTLAAVNSQYVHAALAPWCLRAGIASHARLPHRVRVVESTVNEPREAVLERLAEGTPNLLGISCYIWNVHFIAGLLPRLRAMLPGCAIVLGGPEVSFRAADAMAAFPEADYLIAGEGERPLALLADALGGLGGLTGIPGLCRRQDGRILESAPHAEETVPPLPLSPEFLAAQKGRIAYLETSRGCPYACAFCLSGRAGKTRFLPLPQAFQDILSLANSGAGTVKFVDRTFNADRARAAAILGFIRERAGRDIPKGVAFHFEIAGDRIDRALLDAVENSPAGLFRFEIGLQSMNPETLLRVRRRTDMSRLKENIKALISTGKAHVHLDLIAGLPGEGLESFKAGLDEAVSLKPHALQLGFLKLLHGSAMREEPETYPCRFDSLAPYEVLETPWLSPEDIQVLKCAERGLDKSYNAGRFQGALHFLFSRGVSPFAFFEALGREIPPAEQGQKGHSLEEVTQRIYSAATRAIPDQAPQLRDLLLTDRLASTPTTVMPACLKIPDARFHTAKRALDRRFPREPGALRAFGFLYATPDANLAFCDYERKNPVTELYAVRYVTMGELGM